MIARLAPLLAATHAVVWVREAGKLRIAAQTAGWAESTADRKAVEHMIAAAFETSDVVSLAPGTTLDGVTNPTDEHYLIAPVTLHDWTPADGPAVAVIGCTLPAGRAPSSYRGAEQLLTGVSDLAAEYHVRRNLERLTSERDRDRQRAQFAEQVGGDTDLVRTAMAIANEGRRIVPCDRLSVLTVTGSRGRLLAASGTDHVERRSRAARALEQLASIAVRMDEPIDYSDRADQPTDLAPQLDELVSKYVDEFHTRRLLVVPMPQARHATHNAATRGVLVAEQFGGTTPELDRLAVAELARTAAPPLASAIAWHELPLGSFVQSLAWLKMPRTMFRLALGAALLVGIATALLMIQRPLTIDVRGQLLPLERREVFAPRSGIVDSLAAEHGQRVAAGDTIVVLRDPELAAERERLRGEQTTTQRQLEAIRATRSVAGTPSRDPLELYRLSGEEAELSTQLTNLDRQSRLIEQQTAALTVVSPIAGAVTTWQVDERLAPGRPVERGQVLASVADTAGDWMLELMVPDERLDLLRQSTGEQLMVEYRLGSDASAVAYRHR